MPTIKINDINMYYEVYGEGEPVVLVSGFSADHLTWLFAIEHLSKHYQVLVFDNRGAGRTDIPDAPYSIEQMAGDIAGLCSALNITRAHFVGNSMGGYLVQAVAYHYPALVKSVAICNSGLGTWSSYYTYLSARLEMLKMDIPQSILLRIAAAWVFSPSFLYKQDNLDMFIQLGMQNPYPFTVNGFKGQYAAISAFDSHDWVGKITVPALVIGADSDLVLPACLAEAVHAHLPQSSYYCFKNCGHLPHVEYPEEFSNLIRNFFASVPND